MIVVIRDLGIIRSVIGRAIRVYASSSVLQALEQGTWSEKTRRGDAEVIATFSDLDAAD